MLEMRQVAGHSAADALLSSGLPVGYVELRPDAESSTVLRRTSGRVSWPSCGRRDCRSRPCRRRTLRPGWATCNHQCRATPNRKALALTCM